MLVGGVKQGILVQNEKTVPHTNRLNVSFYSSPPLHICLNIETSLSSAPGFSCQSSCDRDGGGNWCMSQLICRVDGSTFSPQEREQEEGH